MCKGNCGLWTMTNCDCFCGHRFATPRAIKCTVRNGCETEREIFEFYQLLILRSSFIDYVQNNFLPFVKRGVDFETINIMIKRKREKFLRDYRSR
jgi:hypothetical protein